jgi:two-component system NtrC family sensor kinase
MSVFPFLIAIFLFRKVRTLISDLPDKSKWENLIKLGMTIAVTLLMVQILFKHEGVTGLLWSFFLLLLVGIVYREKVLEPARAFSLTILPYAIISMLKSLMVMIASDGFSDQWDGYFDTAKAFAGMWIIASLFTANRQQKAMEKEREKRRQEEELNKVIAARKVELEVLVKERTAALMQQKEELQQALAELRITQDQLIQSEKLASLGELTAGIAHEIQNPLNFVNNFSDVSIELVDEMEIELNKGDKEEAMAIAADIKQNLEKIRHHGKRADGIVKGMLQHSRNKSGERQLTDINVLADEYLRLSYHGLRAKDKSFNATMTTHYQENLPKTSMVPQDIGRVLLNLFNNAFYSINQKQKTAGAAFTDSFLEIRVKDNGTGIPEEIQDKILQPFFTTKPTGEGTGLGLSLSYDIIVKGHGGKIDIESKEGEGAEFIINLPVQP